MALHHGMAVNYHSKKFIALASGDVKEKNLFPE
jgi:hypothetical protein